MTKLIPVDRHILEAQKGIPEATGGFTALLSQITLAAKIITREVRKAGLIDILGHTGDTNVQGEDVQKLDIYANDQLFRALDHCGQVCVMASEENDEILLIPEQYEKGKYVVLFDPLDGSSNINANVSIGTIFSIYRRKSTSGNGTLADCLRHGAEQVCAGYVIYGSSTMLVYCAGYGVHGFTLDPSVGEFLLSHENITIPSYGKYYSVNEGNYYNWDPRIQKYVDTIKQADGTGSRYIGSMVADLHRTLVYGGIFMYPGDNHNPNGKLRLLYEASPMAFIIEAAGGVAITGRNKGNERILDVQPKKLHERTPLFIGSYQNIQQLQKFL